VCVAIGIAAAVLVGAATEKTIKGEAACAKCVLKQAKECHVAIQVKEGDKTLTYYLAENDASKKLEKAVCKDKKKVTATGTVKEADGKLEFTASKIETEQ